MLLTSENRNVERQGVLETAKATIKATPKIFNFFADSTYANKPRAICRELVANGVDAHTAAGTPELPVEVWLPGILDPVFRVRDRGIGMAHEFVMTRFMAYTDGSTKDQSNDQIGGFGIGSKSPFAYVDQFTIVSIHEGTHSVYTMFKDEDGIPSIALLGQQETLDPNGVEVSFPVKSDDFNVFEEAAFEALKYFEPLPLIRNAAEGCFTPPDYVSMGKTWAMRPEAGPLHVIMGGVRYPVDVSGINYKFPSEGSTRNLLGYGLDIKLPIGTCSVALSREGLSYDDRTIAAIRTACEAVTDEVAATFSTMFDRFDTTWDAMVALHKETNDVYSKRGQFLLEHAKYRGEPLTTILMPAPLGRHQSMGYEAWVIDGLGARQTKRMKNRPRVGAARFETPGRITPGIVETVIIDDVNDYKAVRKIKQFIDEAPNEGSIIVLRPHADGITPADLVGALGNPPADQVLLVSELPDLPKAVRRDRGDRPRVRMFTFDGSESFGRYGYRKPTRLNPDQSNVREIPYPDQPTDGVYVVLTNFELPAGFYRMMEVGLISYAELNFLNTGDAAKLDKRDWVEFHVEFESRKREALTAYPELPQRLAVESSIELREMFSFIRSSCHGLALTPTQQRSPFGRILNLYQNYVAPLTNEQRKLAFFVTSKLPARVKPAELLEQFQTKQWRADYLLNLERHSIANVTGMKLLMEIL